MSTLARRRPRRRLKTEEVEDYNNQPGEAGEQPGEASASPSLLAFDPFVTEEQGGLPFDDAIHRIRDDEWANLWLYLYRVQPTVRNPKGEKAYLGKWQAEISEEDIRTMSGGGGGKYYFQLKDWGDPDAGRAPRSRKGDVFSIVGEPNLRADQTVVSSSMGNSTAQPAAAKPPDAPQPAQSESGELARMLPQVLKTIADSRSNNNGNDVSAVMDVMGQATKGALSIMTESMKQTQTTVTGTISGDKLLDMLLEKNKPDRDPLRDKLIEIALTRLENPAAAGGDGGLGQLSALKELFGVDSILDLVKGNVGGGGGGASDLKSLLVDAGKTIFGNLPGILQAFNAMQEAQFRRSLQLEAFRRQQAGQPAAPTIIPAGQPAIAPHPHAGDANGPTPIPAAPFSPPSPSPGMQPNPMVPNPFANADPATMALLDIVACFEASLPGDGTASLIRTKYPEVVQALKPMLADRNQVMEFAQNTPPLSEIAGDPDFPDFLDQFLEELKRGEEEEEEEQPLAAAAAASS